MRDLHIRPARFDDLAALTQSLGQESLFADRMNRQEHGLGVLLTAWLVGEPIGDVYLWLQPAEEWKIRWYLRKTPLLTNIEVHPDHRRRGVGTSLVRAAEQMLLDLGHHRVALAVDETKPDIVGWYGRRGYAEWSHSKVKCYSHSDVNGRRTREICHVLLKRLPG